MEDAMMIHRITRAPERRIFYVNVGAIPPNEVENYMQRMITKMKKTYLKHGHPTENRVYTYYDDTDEYPLSLNSKMMLYFLIILQYKM
jgi:hypothetical protein